MGDAATVRRLERFLSSVPILASLAPEQLAALADRLGEHEYRAGDLILRAGERNRFLYLLESGRLVVQVSRGDARETVAHLHAGAPFGELSFLTGRACAADVRALTDATVAMIPEAALNELPDIRRQILEMLALTVAERLHAAVSQREESGDARVVLLRQSAGWNAPSAFAAELARSLAHQAGWPVLRVEFQRAASTPPVSLMEGVSVVNISASQPVEDMRAELAAQLTSWRRRFACIVLNATPDLRSAAEAMALCSDCQLYLLGPGESLAAETAPGDFVVQESAGPTLPRLSGREQLIDDVAHSERAYASEQPAGRRFVRTVDSIARGIAHRQVGVALGGGGAWAWSHIGVLRVLERAGVPIDAVSGCSMGSVVGALVATGHDAAALEQAAAEWRRLFPRLIEYRFWRMHLARVSGLTRVLRERFGHRRVNDSDIPFWPNALDIEAAEEVALDDGDLVTALLASMALPAWLPPMSRQSRLLVDGVFVNPVPVSLTRRMHCDFNIAINAIGPFRARALPTHFPFRAYELVSRCLRIVGHQVGQAQIEAGADAVLVPELPAETSMLSFDRYQDIIAAGEREAEAQLPSILATYRRVGQAGARPGAAMATP